MHAADPEGDKEARGVKARKVFDKVLQNTNLGTPQIDTTTKSTYCAKVLSETGP